jgi:D-beta-D-heptose 7-phosphate kinase/D-beta-D-heptose 1-phosphate adenosyltransferase
MTAAIQSSLSYEAKRMNPYSEKIPKILVVGDVILDVGIHGPVKKMAAEGPVPVQRAESKTYALGGAGNVAANLRALGAHVWACTPVGTDNAGSMVYTLYEEAGVNVLNPTTAAAHSTPVNTRGFVDGKLLYRYDADETTPYNAGALEDMALEFLGEHIRTHTVDMVVISDYAKGFLTDSFCRRFIQLCTEAGVQTLVDPRGDYAKYIGCTILKPNHKEAAAAADTQDLETIVERLAAYVQPTYLCITAAENGMYIADCAALVEVKCEDQPPIQHIPTQVHDVIDVTGAGDIVSAVISYSVAVGSTIEDACRSAVFLASRSVMHAGTYVLTDDDIWALVRHLQPGKIVRSVRVLQSMPRSGQTVVFTNGCFDLLHRGHLESLRWAKAQGDVLIVGVNSDESVRKLKGMTRPIVSLEDRMEMLAGLECVDYVIPFYEDRPRALIQALRPDVYVKGAEYEGHTFSGQDYVGEVRLAPMYEGMSTTALVRRITQPVNIYFGSGPAGR